MNIDLTFLDESGTMTQEELEELIEEPFISTFEKNYLHKFMNETPEPLSEEQVLEMLRK